MTPKQRCLTPPSATLPPHPHTPTKPEKAAARLASEDNSNGAEWRRAPDSEQGCGRAASSQCVLSQQWRPSVAPCADCCRLPIPAPDQVGVSSSQHHWHYSHQHHSTETASAGTPLREHAGVRRMRAAVHVAAWALDKSCETSSQLREEPRRSGRSSGASPGPGAG